MVTDTFQAMLMILSMAILNVIPFGTWAASQASIHGFPTSS